MAIKKETYLQKQIQKFLEKKGAYVRKNWGSMVTEPGIADLTVCYCGWYLAIEVKQGKNKPSAQQGVHARAVDEAGGLTFVVWSLDDVKKIIDGIDSLPIIRQRERMYDIIFIKGNIGEYDDGTQY